MRVNHIRDTFLQKYNSNDFTIDRTGKKVIEIIGASFIADEDIIFGVFNEAYFEKELNWYYTQNLNISAMDNPPALWRSTADNDGVVNSNYGYLIFSDTYHNQYLNALNELQNNPLSRRATMVYTRPEIQHQYNQNGRNDFICTNAVSYYIRNGELDAVVQMRSNDAVYGFNYDRAWQSHVQQQLADDLDIEVGNLFWQCQNLHVYERHFMYLTKGNKL